MELAIPGLLSRWVSYPQTTPNDNPFTKQLTKSMAHSSTIVDCPHHTIIDIILVIGQIVYHDNDYDCVSWLSNITIYCYHIVYSVWLLFILVKHYMILQLWYFYNYIVIKTIVNCSTSMYMICFIVIIITIKLHSK